MKREYDTRIVIFVVSIVILFGIIVNFGSVSIRNNSEKEFEDSEPGTLEWNNKQAFLNQSKKTSRFLNFFGNSIIIIGTLILLACLYDIINKKINLLENKIDKIISESK